MPELHYPEHLPVVERKDDIACVLWTAGSSGEPKGVLHTQRALASKARTMVDVHRLTADDVVLMPAPLAHISGLLNGVLVAQVAGMRAVFMARWDPEHALDLIEADLVAFGSLPTVQASIDAHSSNRNIVSNNDMMKLVNEIDNANAWAVGKFDAIASKAGIPSEIAAAMPAISWFSAAGHVNGGISGSFKAEAKDEATAKNLRDVMNGFLAMAKMQAANKPGMQQLADSLVVSGEGNTVALAFSVPSEVLDVLEGMAKSRQPQAQ